MKTFYKLVLFGALLPMLPVTGVARAGGDEDGVTQLLMSMFDKPDNHLNVGPIVISGDNGIADWYQGEKGGRALLQRREGKWVLRLCSGDNLKKAAMLVEAGIEQKAAEEMTATLAAEEAKADPAIVAKYSLFGETVVMDGSQ